MLVPSFSVSMERLKDGNVELYKLVVVGRTREHICYKMTFIASVKTD